MAKRLLNFYNQNFEQIIIQTLIFVCIENIFFENLLQG